MGRGTGPPGGGGGRPPESETAETGRDAKKLKGPRHKGKIVGSFLKQGEAPKGEAKLELESAIRSGSRLAEEALEQERMPAELKEIPKQYFDRLIDEKK